jgi:DNA-binding transcriptional ArsR family regulator
MADSGKRQADLISALNHELRRRILRVLHERGESRSPIQLSRQLEKPLSNISYHVRVLERLGALAETDQEQVRGALERFYASAVAGDPEVLAMLAATKEEDEAE